MVIGPVASGLAVVGSVVVGSSAWSPVLVLPAMSDAPACRGGGGAGVGQGGDVVVDGVGWRVGAGAAVGVGPGDGGVGVEGGPPAVAAFGVVVVAA